MSLLRQQVLSLYRRLLRLSQTWNAVNETDTLTERHYIQSETKQLFQANKKITNEEDIAECIREGEARLEIAMHYKCPYPRLVNLPQTVLPPVGNKGKRTQKMLKQAKLSHLQSQDKDNAGRDRT